MPQLDQFTYLTQFVWLCVCFMSFYVLLYNDALPKVSRILKLRSLLGKSSDSSLSSGHTDAAATSQPVARDDVITHALKSSAAYLMSSVSGASQWCNEMVTTVNANQLEAMNKAYVRSLAEMSVANKVHSHALYTQSALASQVASATSKYNRIYVVRAQKNVVIYGKNGVKGTRKKKQQNA